MDNNNTLTTNSPSTTIYLFLDFFSWLTKLCSLINLVITFPIYFSLLHFLYRKKHQNPFNTSFYRLFFALGIVDITKYSLYLFKKCSYWGWVLPLFLPPNIPNKPAQLLYLSLWALSFAQYQLNIFLSLNRFISILLPQIYRHHYTRQFFRFVIWPICLISIAIVIPILQMPVCFRTNIIFNNTQNNEDKPYMKLTGPVFVNQSDLSIYYGITKFFILLLLCCLIGYPLCFIRIRRLNMKDKVLAVEVKMLFALCLLLVANLLYIGYFIFWELISRWCSQLSVFAEWSLYLIIDFYDMNSPYGILLTSKLVRKSVLPFCLFQQQNVVIPLNGGNLRPIENSPAAIVAQLPLVENMQKNASSSTNNQNFETK